MKTIRLLSLVLAMILMIYLVISICDYNFNKLNMLLIFPISILFNLAFIWRR
jgi:type III secretory pathway component EscU